MIQLYEEKQKALQSVISKLSEKQQDVIHWLIENYDAAAAICKAKILAEEESRMIIEQAMQKNDDYLLVLALLERIINAP